MSKKHIRTWSQLPTKLESNVRPGGYTDSRIHFQKKRKTKHIRIYWMVNHLKSRLLSGVECLIWSEHGGIERGIQKNEYIIIRRIAIWSHIIWILITNTLDNTRHVHVLQTHLSSMVPPSPTDHLTWVKNICACIECMWMRPACQLRIDISTKQIPLELVHAWVWTLSIKIYCQFYLDGRYIHGAHSVFYRLRNCRRWKIPSINVYFDFRLGRQVVAAVKWFSQNCVKSNTWMNEWKWQQNETARVQRPKNTLCQSFVGTHTAWELYAKILVIGFAIAIRTKTERSKNARF